MRLTAVNVKGLNGESLGGVIGTLKSMGTEVAVLSESYLNATKAEKLASRYPLVDVYTTSFSSGERGVTVLILNPHKYPPNTVKVLSVDPKGRYLAIEIMVEKRPVRVLGIYTPNTDT